MLPHLLFAFASPTCHNNVSCGCTRPVQFSIFCSIMCCLYIKFTIIYCQLWEFILHLVQQPGALSQNRKYSQKDLGKLYNFDFEHIFRDEPPTSFFWPLCLLPKKEILVFSPSLAQDSNSVGLVKTS